MSSDGKQTLYERIGGAEGIRHLIDAFYDRVLADPELAPFFQDTSMEKLRRMQREFFTVALGGSTDYTGKPLDRAHAGRGITARHLQRFMDHLLATLSADLDLDHEDENAVADRIWKYADDVTGGYGLDG